jgi:hypothetical protein
MHEIDVDNSLKLTTIKYAQIYYKKLKLIKTCANRPFSVKRNVKKCNDSVLNLNWIKSTSNNTLLW